MKIVHVSNFSLTKNGEAFYSMDRKISAGLIQNGHFVYDFSYRDQAKFHRFLGFKQKSMEKMNSDLVQTCANIQPDLLLISKAEHIASETLCNLKKMFPAMKVAQWFVDSLKTENQNFIEQFQYVDCFFGATAEEFESLSKQFPTMPVLYLPNITDPAFEAPGSGLDKEYDIVYIARDHKEDVRYQFALALSDFCKKTGLNVKIYASLGNPPIFGAEYQKAIGRAKIAINFNRSDLLDEVNVQKYMSTSDRMNHFLGMGACVFSPRVPGLDYLYRDGIDVVYFNNANECFQKLQEYLNDNRYAEVAQSGQNRAYAIANAKRVTKYMLEAIRREPYSEMYEWKHVAYRGGTQL